MSVPLYTMFSSLILGAGVYHSICILPVLAYLEFRGPTLMKFLGIACILFGLVRLILQIIGYVNPVVRAYFAVDALASWTSYAAFLCSDTILYLRAMPFTKPKYKWLTTAVYILSILTKGFLYLVVSPYNDYSLAIGIDRAEEIQIVNCGFASIDAISNSYFSTLFIRHLMRSQTQLRQLNARVNNYSDLARLVHIASQYALFGLATSFIARTLRAAIPDENLSVIFLDLALAVDFNTTPSMIIAMNETLRRRNGNVLEMSLGGSAPANAKRSLPKHSMSHVSPIGTESNQSLTNGTNMTSEVSEVHEVDESTGKNTEDDQYRPGLGVNIPVDVDEDYGFAV